MIRKTYRIILKGCDDTTVLYMELSNEEYELLSRMSSLSKIFSALDCQPTLSITEAQLGDGSKAGSRIAADQWHLHMRSRLWSDSQPESRVHTHDFISDTDLTVVAYTLGYDSLEAFLAADENSEENLKRVDVNEWSL